MHVTFGLSLDARQGPSPQSHFNAPIVGRLGFLSLLETYLGLSAPDIPAAQRVAVYLGFLQKYDDGSRFYSQSLKVDSVGTAFKLLAWRDEWRLGGWQGAARHEHPLRLREMAEVESLAAGSLPPGEAERLSAVANALFATGHTPIDLVSLVDPKDGFPLLWRKVLDALPAVGFEPPTPQGEGQLREVQERAILAMSGKGLPDVPLSITDGSIEVVRALSSTTAQQWLNARQAAAPADRLVVAEQAGDALDTMLTASGGVKCGFEVPSQLRPALQALELAIELCWDPLDIGRLMDFLTHPVGPFSRSARARLAQAVSEQPGIGGAAWIAARNKLAALEWGDSLVADIEFWLEGERWKRTDGAPIEALIARVDRLKSALRRRLSGDPEALATFSPAHRQCAAVYDGLVELARQGVRRMLPRELQQLVAHAMPGGATDPVAAAQVGCMRSASTAGACTEPADEVIWWMPATPALIQQLPWTPAEILALQELGVELREPARELESLAMQWLRPLLAARKRFVLVLPPPDAEIHPIRQLTQQLVAELEISALDLDSALEQQELGELAEQVQPLALPESQDCIQLPKPPNITNVKQSYTALNELFSCPALFALKRVAHLEPTFILAAEEDNRLLGILAHRVFEKLFAHPDALSWSDEKALDWFRSESDMLLQTEGAVLLMHGASISLQRFRMTCEGAICGLLDHLRSAGAARVQTEAEFAGSLGAVPLTGKIDLLVELRDKRLVAIDMKWRRERYYADLLRNGGFLQLALYSNLVEQQTGSTPEALGYFILESGALFLTQEGLFPKALLRRPPEGVTVDSLLDQAKATWSWRTTQFMTGQIAVVPEKPTADHQGPPGTLPVNGPSRWDQDHLVLLGGWER
jgi:hypothetical protein